MIQRDAKTVTGPVEHFTGAHRTKVTYQGGVQPMDESSKPTYCAHTHGHQTQDAAMKCAKAMWRKLPKA